MKTHILFLPLIFLLGIVNLNAQKKSNLKNKIELELGANKTYLKDYNLSPLNIKGGGTFMGIEYIRTTKSEDILQTSLNISISELTSEASEFFMYDRFLFSFDVNYLKKIKLKNQPFSLHAGLGVFTMVDAVFYNGTDAVSFFSLHGIQTATMFNYQFHKKQNIGVSLSIPIIGLLNRPPYTGWDKYIIEQSEKDSNILAVFYRGDIKTIGAFLNFDLSLDYTYSLSKLIDIGIAHKIKYWYTKEIKKAIINTNFTSVQLTFKF